MSLEQDCSLTLICTRKIVWKILQVIWINNEKVLLWYFAQHLETRPNIRFFFSIFNCQNKKLNLSPRKLQSLKQKIKKQITAEIKEK